MTQNNIDTIKINDINTTNNNNGTKNIVNAKTMEEVDHLLREVYRRALQEDATLRRVLQEMGDNAAEMDRQHKISKGKVDQAVRDFNISVIAFVGGFLITLLVLFLV